MKEIVLVAFSIAALVGCSPSPKTPEGLLRMFVNDVTTKRVDRDYYLKHTTGDLKASVEEMTEEEIKEGSYLENVKKAKVEILHKNCQDLKCALTYVVTYDTYDGEKAVMSSENRKLAEFEKVDDEWKIASVTNLKSYYEGKEPLQPDED